jgi:hypothetical protein
MESMRLAPIRHYGVDAREWRADDRLTCREARQVSEETGASPPCDIWGPSSL